MKLNRAMKRYMLGTPCEGPDQGIPLEADIATLKKQNNELAVAKGMPPIGSVMVNAHGIEWLVDGHTTAPSILGVDCEHGDLYPALMPQNLSKELTEFVAEINRCTPKALMALDTMPALFPKRGHPHGHWVDGLSDPYRILLFIDAARIHETVLAHELAHVWIDLVRGIEDYRVLEDRSNTARYSQVQLVQSFVLDVAVNSLLVEKGFDVGVIAEHSRVAVRNLIEASSRGYEPPTKREGAFLGAFLAGLMLDVDSGAEAEIVGYENLPAVKRELPEVYHLGEKLANVIRRNPPTSAKAARAAIDEALSLSFEFCGEEIDLERELIEIAPECAYDCDKHPEWLRGLSVQAKCEVGVAMARLGASSTALSEMSCAPNGKVRVRFQHYDGGFTDYAELECAKSMPGVISPQLRMALEENERNRRRIDEMMGNANATGKPAPPNNGLPGGFMPWEPGGRSYSAGLAMWTTQARLQEQLQGEKPYAYANNNPVTYSDPSGLCACPWYLGIISPLGYLICLWICHGSKTIQPTKCDMSNNGCQEVCNGAAFGPWAQPYDECLDCCQASFPKQSATWIQGCATACEAAKTAPCVCGEPIYTMLDLKDERRTV